MESKTFFETRSIRKFSSEPVSEEVVKEIIIAAGQSPSGLNKQPWLYFIIRDSEIKEEIRTKAELIESEYYRRINQNRKKEFEAMNLSIKKQFLTDAPYLVVVFANSTCPYFIESTWISIGWFMLSAQQHGLATLTYTPEKMDWLNKILEVPEEYKAQAILPLGYGEKKGKKIRKRLDEIIRFK